MKKIYSFLLFCFVGIAASLAQPTYTLSSFPTIGTSSTSYDVSAAVLAPGGSGANQTWNFAGVTGTLTPNTVTMVAPSATPFSSTFPSSTIAAQTISNQGNDAYGYYITGSSAITLIGAGTNGTTPILFSYSNPETALTLPFTYGSLVDDDYTAHASYTANGILIDIYRTGHVTTLADGFGTLITPTGTYTNCLRIKAVDATRDSIVYTGIPIPATISLNNSTSYNYSGPGSTNAIFMIVFDTSSTSGTVTPTFSATYSTFSTDIKPLSQVKELSMFPNPAYNVSELTLQINELNSGAAVLNIFDLNGRKVKSEEVNITNRNNFSVDISGLSRGLFILQIQQGDLIYRGNLIR